MSLVSLALNGGITGRSFGLKYPRLRYYRFLLLPYKHELHATAQSGMVFGTLSYGLVGHFICSDWTAYMVTDFWGVSSRSILRVMVRANGRDGFDEGLYKGESRYWSGRIISQKATATALRR
jgi:hypothetical protein